MKAKKKTPSLRRMKQRIRDKIRERYSAAGYARNQPTARVIIAEALILEWVLFEVMS